MKFSLPHKSMVSLAHADWLARDDYTTINTSSGARNSKI